MTLFEINKRLANLIDIVRTAIIVFDRDHGTDEEYKVVQKDFYKVSAQIEVANIVNAGIKCDTSHDEMMGDFNNLVRLYTHVREEHYRMVSRTMLANDFPNLKKNIILLIDFFYLNLSNY